MSIPKLPIIKSQTNTNAGMQLQPDVSSLFQQGLALFQRGQLLQAQMILEQLLTKQPLHFDALHLSGLIAAQNKNSRLAAEFIGKAIQINPNNAAAYFNHAVALQELNRLEESVSSYNKAIHIKPQDAEAYFNRGNALQKLKRREEALASYARAIAIRPDYAAAHHNLGIGLQELNRQEEAIVSFDRAIAIRPGFADAHFTRGNALQRLKRLEEARASYERAISIKPDYVEAYISCGNVLLELKLLDEALAFYDKAITIDPDHAKAHSNRGCVLLELLHPEGALDCFNKAVAIEPDYAEAHYNRGNALLKLRHLEAALASFDKALSIKPVYTEALFDRGNLLRELSRYPESVADFKRLIEINPQFADAYWNKSITHLFMGEWATAWDLYPWRWRRSDTNPDDLMPPLSTDRFGRASDKPKMHSLCIWAEQGVGDEIFYASMFAEAAAHFGLVTVQIDSRLITLLGRSIPEVVFVDKATPVNLGNFDLHLAHGDLGYFFRREIGDFQRIKSRYLLPDSRRTESLRASLQTEGKLLCGITWRSNNDRIGRDKSIGLEKLLPILRSDAIQFVNLQYGDTSDELASFKAEYGVDIVNCGAVDNFSDLDGHAALIQACDFIVTVSNSTAHIAGALGKPTHLMLSHGDGKLWYWANRYGNQSMWYPAVQIFEQTRFGEWDDVVSRLSTTVTEKYLATQT